LSLNPTTSTFPFTILQVVPELETGGVERTAIDVANAIVQAGGNALVASQGGQMVRELDNVGGRHIVLPLKSKNPVTIWRNAARLQKVIRKHKVAIVHARSRAPAWSALIAARREKIPFVTTYHGTYNQKSALKAAYNSVMARGDRVIANSHFIAGMIAERHPCAKDRIITIHRGSDLEGLSPAAVSPDRKKALAGQWGLPAGRPIAMNLARLTGWKGQKVIIEAMAIFKARGETAPIAVLAGDSQGRTDYLAELKALIAARGVEDQVRIVGHCADVPAALALASVLIVASIEPEAFGRAAVEAQAAEVPVIVSDLGAVPETVLAPPDVEDGKRTGWRLPPGDAEALANAVSTALSLPASSKKSLIGRARAHVAAKFTVEAMTGATLDVYRGLLSVKRKG